MKSMVPTTFRGLRRSVIACALLPAVAAVAWASSPAKLTLEDLADASGVSSVALSPNGRQFALARDEQIELVAPMAAGRLSSPRHLEGSRSSSGPRTVAQSRSSARGYLVGLRGWRWTT